MELVRSNFNKTDQFWNSQSYFYKKFGNLNQFMLNKPTLTNWNQLQPTETNCNQMEPVGIGWNQFEKFQKRSCLFEQLFLSFTQFELLWTSFNQFEPVWAILNQCEPVCTSLSSLKQFKTFWNSRDLWKRILSFFNRHWPLAEDKWRSSNFRGSNHYRRTACTFMKKPDETKSLD